VDAELVIPFVVSTLQAVLAPVDALNSSIASPVYVEATLAEKFTVTVDAPDTVTVPVHISRS
jgi:hypothetical protein